METEKVNLAAWRLAKTAESLHTAASGLNTALQSLNWEGPSRDAFVAESRQLLNRIRQQAEVALLLSQRMRHEVDEWLAVDGQGMEQTREISHLLIAAAFPMIGAGGVLFATGQVAGVSISVESSRYIQEYKNMAWRSKFQEEERLRSEIAASQQRLAGMRTEQELQSEINSIDAQIAELEQKKAAAQAEAERWYNQIIPDWPLQGDSDGVAWRVRADDFEDQVADYNRQIEALQAQKQPLQADLAAQQQEAARLAGLQSRQSALSDVINQGTPLDGPSEWHRYFSGTDTTNCTKYAASKRDVPCRGDAFQWNEQAEAGGFETGNRPVKGSVLVIEPDPAGKQSHVTKGHVAIVEEVSDLGNGQYRVRISEGNWGGKYSERDVIITTGSKSASIDGVSASFIYGRKK